MPALAEVLRMHISLLIHPTPEQKLAVNEVIGTFSQEIMEGHEAFTHPKVCGRLDLERARPVSRRLRRAVQVLPVQQGGLLPVLLIVRVSPAAALVGQQPLRSRPGRQQGGHLGALFVRMQWARGSPCTAAVAVADRAAAVRAASTIAAENALQRPELPHLRVLQCQCAPRDQPKHAWQCGTTQVHGSIACSTLLLSTVAARR